MTTQYRSRQELETHLIAKASQNPIFRQCLLDDPKAALAEMLGVALPPGVTITVLEEAPGHHYLVLPPATPALDALPLDDLELALVGGGRTLRPFVTLRKMSTLSCAFTILHLTGTLLSSNLQRWINPIFNTRTVSLSLGKDKLIRVAIKKSTLYRCFIPMPP